MYLESSAMTLFEEFHRTLEADRRREMHEALRRAALLESRRTSGSDGGVERVPLGDRAGGGGDRRPDLGRSEDFHPATRS
jgi:hypothetical protein